MRTFVIGDIHGCFDELIELTQRIGLQDNDLLISLGDIVDRGNKSKEVYEYFVNRPNSVVLMGNHERKHQNKILSYAQELLNTHKESFNQEANKQSFKTFIFKSRSNNLTVEDLQKSLNTPNKVLKIKTELGI